MDSRGKPAVIVIAGPTGIGKTALSLRIARVLPVEIVSADSRQIYRYMDIGTAKPTAEEQAIVPHHLIDILDPDQQYSAGRYSEDGRRIIADIFARNKTPLIVGGSGLYIRALLDGFFKDDYKDPILREKLDLRLQEEGAEALYRELQRVDPETAHKTHANNAHRVLRALEVFYLTGKSISEIRIENRDPAPFSWSKFGLIMEREALYRRTNRRVKEMLRTGLVDEVKRLLEMGYAPELNALNSVGYSEVIAYLAGRISLDKCEENIKRNTRRYAKRQLTWFRSERDIHWLPVDPDLSRENNPDALPDEIMAVLNR